MTETLETEIPEETALYRIFGGMRRGRLLYIGISKDFGKRWKQEAATFPWWDEKRRMATHWYPSRPEAAAAETAAIKAEHPKTKEQARQAADERTERRRARTGGNTPGP